MATSSTNAVAFAESFVRFVWFCYRQFAKQDGSVFEGMIRHWDDGDSDYHTGQNIISVPEDEVYDPLTAIMDRARHVAALHGEAIRIQRSRRIHKPEVATEEGCASFIAKLAMEVAKPIFDEARSRTKWNKTPLQYDTIYKCIVRGRALQAIWWSVGDAYIY